MYFPQKISYVWCYLRDFGKIGSLQNLVRDQAQTTTHFVVFPLRIFPFSPRTDIPTVAGFQPLDTSKLQIRAYLVIVPVLSCCSSSV